MKGAQEIEEEYLRINSEPPMSILNDTFDPHRHSMPMRSNQEIEEEVRTEKASFTMLQTNKQREDCSDRSHHTDSRTMPMSQIIHRQSTHQASMQS